MLGRSASYQTRRSCSRGHRPVVPLGVASLPENSKEKAVKSVGQTKRDSSTGFVDELGGRFEAFRLSRSEDQERFGIFALQCSKRDESKWFLRSDNAARDDDWGTAATLGFYLEPKIGRASC